MEGIKSNKFPTISEFNYKPQTMNLKKYFKRLQKKENLL